MVMPRSTLDRARVDAVSRQLRQMFQALENRPIPDRLMSIIDQLDDSDVEPAQPARLASRRATSA
ncbi:MAG: NepR family anti-sigma factor [Phenylobacterium sp.]